MLGERRLVALAATLRAPTLSTLPGATSAWVVPLRISTPPLPPTPTIPPAALLTMSLDTWVEVARTAVSPWLVTVALLMRAVTSRLITPVSMVAATAAAPRDNAPLTTPPKL